MIDLKLGHPAEFPFVDKPLPKNIKDGFETLVELGAVSGKGRDFALTPLGRRMARMPLDPKISRMLLEAEKESCLREVAVIASALSIRDPKERPPDQAGAADAKHAPFRHPDSDFLTLLNIWDACRKADGESGSRNKLKKFCGENFLSYPRVREWGFVHDQVLSILEEQQILARPARETRDVQGALRGHPPGRPERVPIQHRRPQGKKHLYGGQGPGGDDIPGLFPVREIETLDRGRGDGPDVPAFRPDGGGDRPGSARKTGGRPLPVFLFRSALGSGTGRGDGQGKSHPLRARNRVGPERLLRTHRPGRIPGDFRPLRPRRRRHGASAGLPPPQPGVEPGRSPTWRRNCGAGISWPAKRRSPPSTKRGWPGSATSGVSNG